MSDEHLASTNNMHPARQSMNNWEVHRAERIDSATGMKTGYQSMIACATTTRLPNNVKPDLSVRG
jgi:hypothetical protein